MVKQLNLQYLFTLTYNQYAIWVGHNVNSYKWLICNKNMPLWALKQNLKIDHYHFLVSTRHTHLRVGLDYSEEAHWSVKNLSSRQAYLRQRWV
jgi:hypothetical protein